jgi:hypothetical protein
MIKKILEKDEMERKKKSEIGNKYVCGVCGLGVVVNEDCCCEGVCDLVCCGEKMTLC